MRHFFRTLLLSLSLFFALSSAAYAADGDVKWSLKVNELGNNTFELVFSGKVDQGWHIYDLGPYEGGPNPTLIEFDSMEGFTKVGAPYVKGEIKKVYDDIFEMEIGYLEGTAVIAQKIRLTNPAATVAGYVEWQACNDYACLPLGEWLFSVELKGNNSSAFQPQIQEPRDGNQPAKTEDTVATGENDQAAGNNTADVAANSENTDAVSKEAVAPAVASVANSSMAGTEGKSIWKLIFEAILWGFAAFLTPCVFPMAPMTVSYFMKGAENKALGKFRAGMYGLFIILLYTIPIALLILISLIIGGNAVTADIFNWLSTHWIPNVLFFLIFMVFAASFFGAFEITLPSRWTNKTDSNADKKGLGGIFFMALTLVLVSFSCTGPIVGSVLIKATQGGEFWTPVITMFAFSVAFALPFTILAFFPSLLTKLKSGSWLNSVKVVLGFIEVALGFKFLSTADQTYRWGLLDREVYLGIWIVVFTLLGIYLLGKLKFKHDSDVKFISVPRLALAMATFTFVAYMVPGLWGAPLKALSGYLPSITTQDFVLGNNIGGIHVREDIIDENIKYAELTEELPHGLHGYFEFNQGLEAARKADKPLFIDFTGHGCVNCREMETVVWSNPEVLNLLRNEFVMVALYGDNKKDVPEEDWVTLPNGRVLKGLGKINTNLVNERYMVNAQPTYIIVDNDGNAIMPPRGYNKDIPEYIKFLKAGIAAYKESK